MTKDEALKLALEALGKAKRQIVHANVAPHGCIDEAITAIKEVQAQPEQQSAQYWAARAEHDAAVFMLPRSKKIGSKVYTSPPQRQPLTHEQRFDLLTAFEKHKHEWNAHAILIDMVEAAHNIGDKT